MATKIDGKKVSLALREALKTQIADFIIRTGVTPGLAVVLVGEDPASSVYVKNKHLACLEVGIHSEVYRLPAETEESELLALLEDIHADGLDGRANKAYLTPEFAAELAKRDLSLAIWTVDDVETAEYFINTVKPEAITSNRAAYLQGVIDLGKDR